MEQTIGLNYVSGSPLQYDILFKCCSAVAALLSVLCFPLIFDVTSGYSAPGVALFIFISGFLLVHDRYSAYFVFAGYSTLVPLALSISSQTHNSFSILAYLASRELFVGIMFLSATPFIKNVLRTWNGIDLAFLMFVAFHFAMFFLSPYGLIAKIVSIKDVAFLGVSYFTGRLLFFSKSSSVTERFRSWSIIALLPCLITSSVLVFMNEKAWLSLGISDYFQHKFQGAKFQHLLEIGFPPNFYTYVFGERLFRNVGPILDSPGTSRFLAFFLIYFYARCQISFARHKHIPGIDLLLVIWIFLVQLSNMSRGGILVDMIGISFIYLHIKNTRILTLTLITFAIAAFSLMVSTQDPNTARHVDGLTSGFQEVRLLGHGIGSGGQQALNYASSEVGGGQQVKESYIGGLVYQTGIVGLVLFLYMLALIFRLCVSIKRINSLDFDAKILIVASSGAVFAILATSALANSAFSFYSLVMPIFAFGVSVSSLHQGRSRRSGDSNVSGG